MSISSLPPELLRQIISHTIPPTLPQNFEQYQERQCTLSSLCCVSKPFLFIAQPLLFEIAWVDNSPETLDNFVDAIERKGWNDVLRMVAIEEYECKVVTPAIFENLCKNAQRLKTLVLDLKESEPLDLSLLSDLTNLHFLRLFGTQYIASTPLLLSNLKSLAFDGDAVPSVSSFLNPTALPSLRSFALVTVWAPEDLNQLGGISLSGLRTQLDAVFIDSKLMINGPGFEGQGMENALVDVSLDELDDLADSALPFHHLRIRELDESLEEKDFEALASRIQTDSLAVPLRSLYFDLAPPSDSPSDHRTYEGLQTLTRICGEKGIEVIFEERLSDSIDSYGSDEFWRRQRERQRATRGEV